MTNVVKIPNNAKKRRTTVTSSFDKSRFMKRAHALAKTYQGDYIARLALAMKELYVKVERPVLVASYKYHAGEEKLIRLDSGVQLMTPRGNVVITTGSECVSERYNRDRALHNGMKHLMMEQAKAWAEFKELKAIGDERWKLAKIKADLLTDECKKAMNYKPDPVIAPERSRLYINKDRIKREADAFLALFGLDNVETLIPIKS